MFNSSGSIYYLPHPEKTEPQALFVRFKKHRLSMSASLWQGIVTITAVLGIVYWIARYWTMPPQRWQWDNANQLIAICLCLATFVVWAVLVWSISLIDDRIDDRRIARFCREGQLLVINEQFRSIFDRLLGETKAFAYAHYTATTQDFDELAEIMGSYRDKVVTDDFSKKYIEPVAQQLAGRIRREYEDEQSKRAGRLESFHDPEMPGQG